jgi:hypothetical protein
MTRAWPHMAWRSCGRLRMQMRVRLGIIIANTGVAGFGCCWLLAAGCWLLASPVWLLASTFRLPFKSRPSSVIHLSLFPAASRGVGTSRLVGEWPRGPTLACFYFRRHANASNSASEDRLVIFRTSVLARDPDLQLEVHTLRDLAIAHGVFLRWGWSAGFVHDLCCRVRQSPLPCLALCCCCFSLPLRWLPNLRGVQLPAGFPLSPALRSFSQLTNSCPASRFRLFSSSCFLSIRSPRLGFGGICAATYIAVRVPVSVKDIPCFSTV